MERSIISVTFDQVIDTFYGGLFLPSILLLETSRFYSSVSFTLLPWRSSARWFYTFYRYQRIPVPGRAAIREGFSPSSSPQRSPACSLQRAGFIIYAHSQEKRIARVQRYISPGESGEGRSRVQVGTGRRTISRERDSPSCFIHACLVNFDIPCVSPGFIQDLAWLTRFDREHDRSVESREKKRKLWIFSLFLSLSLFSLSSLSREVPCLFD